MKPLKAYEVHDGGDNWEIVFATNSATARREGGSEMGCDWDGVEYCRRRPALDQFAPGPVPPLALIEQGWHFECFHCGCRVDEEMEEIEADPDFDTWSDPEPVQKGQFVYCSQSCASMDAARRRGRKAAEAALIDLVETKYPGSTATHAHVYGDRLESEHGHCSATFTFPGGKFAATYKFGDGAWVSQCDADAFRALYRKEGA
ncbi:hypothetical protein [Cupriavidus sp. IDO]|uniref:hypothetical protein n=1 Tax=Cupriavidus sp. IDO TaxID=1539142 RepID=UPI00068F9081|nr:hypothetical protein [Cupriavidus sp. IDO]KWR88811.1 hypothetical protein RM96_18040 [Cupriavidus sp. IDO]